MTKRWQLKRRDYDAVRARRREFRALLAERYHLADFGAHEATAGDAPAASPRGDGWAIKCSCARSAVCRRDRKKLDGRNPKTGEKLIIAARRTPVFTAGKSLRDAVGRPKKKSAPKAATKVAKKH